MSRHLIAVPDRDELIKAGLRAVVCEYFAADIIAGKIVYNIATDEFIGTDVATDDDREAAVEALAVFLETQDADAPDGWHPLWNFANPRLNRLVASEVTSGKLILNVMSGEFAESEAASKEFKEDATTALMELLMNRDGYTRLPIPADIEGGEGR